MPRPALLLSCVLLVATGLALVGLAQTASPLAVPAAPVESADAVATARAFYAAANEVLATGDPSPLDDLVAQDYLAYPPRADPAGRAGLADALLARRAVFPGLRLAVDDLRSAGGNLVAARVHAAGASTGSFLGLAVPTALADWGPVELLRVSEGRVAERWAGAGEAALLDPLWQATVPATVADAAPVVALRRVTWQPGSEWAVERNPAAWFLLVEQGTVEVAAEPASPVPPDSAAPAVLAPGDLAAVPPGAGFAARNGGTAPATALAVALRTPFSVSPITGQGGGPVTEDRDAVALGPGWGALGETALAPGVVAEVLATARGVPVPDGATLALGRVVLAPGAALALPAAGALVVAVEAGGIGLVAESGIAWTIDADGGMREARGRAAVAAGAGVLAKTGPVGLWQEGADPAVVLVLAVAPAAR